MSYIKKTLNNIHPKQLHLSVLEFVFWAAYAAYQPFLVLFLQGKGLSNTSIGMILSMNSFIMVLAQPLWGMASDWVRSVKKVFLLCLVANTIIIQVLPLLHSTIALAITMALLTAFESPLPPLLDSWVIREIRHEKDLSYGNIRLWGSLGFSVFAYIFGVLVDRTSIRYNFGLFGIMVIPIILLIIKIKDEDSGTTMPLRDMKVGKLLKNYSYITFLLFSMVLYVPHRASYSFLPNLLMAVGGSPGTLGITSALMAFSEVPMFFLTHKLLRRRSPIHLILISAFFFLARQAMYLMATSPQHVIWAQLLHGPSYALFLNGAVYYIDSLAPDDLKSTAQTLATSLYMGASGIMANFGGGWVIDNLGIRRLYSIGICIILVATLLFAASLILGKRNDGRPSDLV